MKHQELSQRTGVVSYAGYSYTGDMTIHAVEYGDGTRDVVRRVGETERITPVTQVTVASEQVDAETYWLAIAKFAKAHGQVPEGLNSYSEQQALRATAAECRETSTTNAEMKACIETKTGIQLYWLLEARFEPKQ